MQDEVLRKSEQDSRFSAAATVWKKLTPTWIQILDDDPTPDLARTVGRIAQQPMAERLRTSKDLGEIMVIAHAVVAAETGGTVNVLIDDGPGSRLATAEIRRLDRLRRTDTTIGTIQLINTLTVLEKAAGGKHLPGKAEMRTLYQRLRGLDDGLPPIETTRLLSASLWTPPSRSAPS